MFGNIKQLMEMKKQADRLKKELESVTVEVNDFEGIRVVMSGTQDLKSIDISESLLRPENKKNLERDLLRSINASVKKVQGLAAQRMSSMVPGM